MRARPCARRCRGSAQLPRDARLQARVVRRDDQRCPVRFRRAQQQVGDGRRGLVVEIGRGLVREHQRGRFTSARAMATRCCWPIDSWCGYASTRSSTPSASSIAQRRAAVHRQPGDALRDQQVLQHGQRRQQVELLQHDADVLPAKAVARARREPREVLPVDAHLALRVGSSSPATRCSSVVLPQPEGPTTRACACGSSAKSSSRSTSTRGGSRSAGARCGSSP